MPRNLLPLFSAYCAVNLARFRLRPARQKLRHVLTAGRYLAQRVDPHRGPVSLYYLAGDAGKGYFAEVGYDARHCRAVLRRLFRRPHRLYRYVADLRLPLDG